MPIISQLMSFSPSGFDHVNIRKTQSQFSSTLFVSSISKLPLFFLPTHPFSSRTQISLSSIYIMIVEYLHSFPSMFLSGDSHEDTNGASSSSLFAFSCPVEPIQACGVDHIPFPRFKYLLLSVLLIFIHLSLLNCSGVLKISRRFVFPLCIRSSSFEIGISFKSFNSTGTASLLNLFNGVLLSGP